MTVHATLGASSAYRWTACPGSIRLIEQAPDEIHTSSVYAEEGTAAHEMATVCLRENLDALECIDRTFNGRFVCDEDMASAVQVLLDTVRRELEPGDTLLVERVFSLDALQPPEPMFGTADVVIYKPKLKKLIVIDYKHGQGVAVEAPGNKQTRYYALGACLSLSELVIGDIEIVIVQPRAPHRDGPVRRERVTIVELIDWSADLLDHARRTREPDAPLAAGDWCKFCPVTGTCPELRRQAVAVARTEFTDLDAPGPVALRREPGPPPETLTAEQLGQILSASGVLQEWLRAVQRHAFDLMARGAVVPGWKLVSKRARRKWREDEEATAAQLMIGFDLTSDEIYKTPVLKSPAQVEKLLVRPRRAELAKLVDKSPTGVTLAREDDKRPALPPSALQDFAAIPDEAFTDD